MNTPPGHDAADERTDADKLADWRAQIELRAQGLTGRTPRGAGRSPRPPAPDAWWCEGRWQCDDQLDIWQCLDQVELDERAARGDTDAA